MATLAIKIPKWDIEEENEKASLYNELWRKANYYALDNLQGEQAEYFYHLTD